MNGSTSRCRSTARVAEAVWSWSAAHRNIRKRSYGARWRAALISPWAAATGVAAESKAGIRCRRPMRWAWAACNWGRNRDRELACLLWTSPAWKMKPRDAWIGWSDEQRQRHLQGIVNNGRFLILPWVRVQGLASKILALNARRMPRDWQTRYGHRPLLLETLVDAQRFRGTCYRAANWIYVGQTAGRGRMDRSSHQRYLRVPAGPRCPATPMRRARAVNKYSISSPYVPL